MEVRKCMAGSEGTCNQSCLDTLQDHSELVERVHNFVKVL